MPCSYNGVLVTKLITQFPQNNPRIQSVLTVHDAKEGSMKALLESNLLTAARTAAMSAVATKYLAPTNSKVLAILGAGVQAKSHYFALQSVTEFEEVRIWNRNYLKAETLAMQLGCRACESAEEAVRGADVITTVTGSNTPVLKYEWVTNGAHINCVGGNRPSWQELDPKLMQNAIVYTDTIESAMEESGDIILSKCKIYAEIGDLVNRAKPVKRDQTTVFKSLGMAAMDAAAAKLIYETYTAENKMQAVAVISEETVKRFLTYSELIPIISSAFGQFSRGQDGGVVQPVRMMVPVQKHNGMCYVMPCLYDGYFSTKIVTFFKDNVDLPSHNAYISLFDGTNGAMRALIAGETITAKRTAAMSAVATKFLARTNSKILAILGTGTQARSHFLCLTSIFSFEEVRIWGRTFSKAEALATELSCKPCESAEEAVRGADIIVTATSSSTPVLKYEWVKPGAHVNGVGACRSTWQELDPELMRNATVYADSMEAIVKESGDVILSKCDVYAEIGDLVNGTKEARADQTTVFKSLGLAVMDTVTSTFVYKKYCENELKCDK
ncbi:ketimine reductase mu-crystallin-like [Antedon mediterranea]|uniref:ketimine reductase mu-crystallin-like n=1 Tax=Antedon mediterranea TaxID=105859 RepID=UPI003AF8EB2F